MDKLADSILTHPAKIAWKKNLLCVLVLMRRFVYL
jgi:hypothetical protein